MTEKTFNKVFSTFLLVGMAVAIVLTTIFKWNQSGAALAMLLISAFGSMMGILATVTAANGMVITFLFGLIDVTIYGAVCFINWRQGHSGLGNAIMHMVYFVPMQFVGYFQWRRRGASSETKVKARRMTGRQYLLYAGVFAAASVAAYIVLARFDRSAATSFIKMAVVLDVIPLICNILGQLLMSMAYMEQWIFWIGVNISSILMWSFTLGSGGGDFAAIYLIKYSFYLVNSLNGLRIWLKLSRPEDTIAN